jgi:hypothetical protein
VFGAEGLSSNIDSSNIDEMDANGHPLRQTSIEGTDLSMDVSEEREPRPSPSLHDQRVINVL